MNILVGWEICGAVSAPLVFAANYALMYRGKPSEEFMHIARSIVRESISSMRAYMAGSTVMAFIFPPLPIASFAFMYVRCWQMKREDRKLCPTPTVKRGWKESLAWQRHIIEHEGFRIEDTDIRACPSGEDHYHTYVRPGTEPSER